MDDTPLLNPHTRPRRMRSPAKIYRLIKRKNSRYIAVRLKNGKQRSSKEIDREAARAFAYRWLASDFPALAREVGIDITPELLGLKAQSSKLKAQSSKLKAQSSATPNP